MIKRRQGEKEARAKQHRADLELFERFAKLGQKVNQSSPSRNSRDRAQTDGS
jgi:hypothetical protein